MRKGFDGSAMLRRERGIDAASCVGDEIFARGVKKCGAGIYAATLAGNVEIKNARPRFERVGIRSSGISNGACGIDLSTGWRVEGRAGQARAQQRRIAHESISEAGASAGIASARGSGTRGEFTRELIAATEQAGE